MNAYLYELLNEFGYYLPGFKKGLITGIVIVIVILVALRLLFWFLSPKNRRCKGVHSSGDGGALFISSTAISDLINALECEFDGIKFTKTALFKKGSKYYIKLTAELNAKDINFPGLVSMIRDKIFDSLRKNLGIDCIGNIDIHLRKVNNN